MKQIRFNRNKLALGVAAAFAISVFSDGVFADADKMDLNIKKQNAGKALMSLGEQAGVEILLTREVGSHVELSALQGQYSLKDALDVLLKNSGLVYEFISDDTVLVKEAESEDGRKGQLQEKEVEEIVVTGSHLVKDPGKLSKQMSVFSREDIERSGMTRLDEFLRRLPQNVNAPTNVGGGFVSDGYGNRDFGLGSNVFAGSGINLRGLGSQYTLVLIDGRRPASGGQFGAITDISNIPIDRVERIEILFDGAASVYGADAIGGVVNIITNRKYDGTNVNLTYSDTTDGGGKRYNFSLGHTFFWESGSLTGTFGYQTQDDIDGAARDLELVEARAFSNNPSLPGTVAGRPPYGSSKHTAVMWVKDVDGDGRYDTESQNERISGGVTAGATDWWGGTTTVSINREAPSVYSYLTLDDPSVLTNLQASLPQDNGYTPVRILQLPESSGQPLSLYDIDLTDYDASVEGREGIVTESAYAPRSGQSLSPEDNTYTVGLTLDQELSEDLTLAVSANYSTTEKRNNTRGSGDEFTVLGTSLTNPFGLDMNYSWANEFPQQYQESQIDSYSLTGSLNWDVNDKWDVVFGWGVSKADQGSDSFNELIRNSYSGGVVTLYNLLNGYYLDETYSQVPIEGVVFHDPYLGFDSAEELVAAVVNPKIHTENNSFSRDMDINIRGVVAELPGGDLRTNFTLSHQRKRNEIFNDNSTYQTAGDEVLGNIGDAPLYNKEVYDVKYGGSANAVGFEVAAPLVGTDNAKPFIQGFLVSASARFEDYSNTDDNGELWSLGFNWQLVDDFAIRLNRDHGVKVPDSVRSALGIESKNNGRMQIYADDTQQQQLGWQSIMMITGGSDQLSPEINDNIKLGFIYTPSFMDGLTMEVSFTDMEAKDRLAPPGLASYVTPDQLQSLATMPQAGLFYATEEIIAKYQAMADAGKYYGPLPTLTDPRNGGNPTLIRDGRLFNVGSLKQQQADFQLRYNFSSDWGEWFVTWRHQYLHKQAYLQSDFCSNGDCFSSVGQAFGGQTDKYNEFVDIVETLDDRDFDISNQIYQAVPKHSTSFDVFWQYRGLGVNLRTDYRSDTSRIRRDFGYQDVNGDGITDENLREITTSPTRSLDMTLSYDFSGDLFDAPKWLESTRISLTVDDVWRREQEVTQKFIQQIFEPPASQKFVRPNGYALEPRGRAFSLSISSSF